MYLWSQCSNLPVTSPVSLHFERPRQKVCWRLGERFLGHRHPWVLLISVGVYCKHWFWELAEGLWSYRHRSGLSPAASVVGAVTPWTQPPARPPHRARCPASSPPWLLPSKYFVRYAPLLSVLKKIWPHFAACGILVSLTRDRTCVPCIGSTDSQPLDHQGSPQRWTPLHHARKTNSRNLNGREMALSIWGRDKKWMVNSAKQKQKLSEKRGKVANNQPPRLWAQKKAQFRAHTQQKESRVSQWLKHSGLGTHLLLKNYRGSLRAWFTWVVPIST